MPCVYLCDYEVQTDPEAFPALPHVEKQHCRAERAQLWPLLT